MNDAAPTLAQQIKAAMAERGLPVAAAAKAIGVAVPGLRRILAGTSRPNARTAGAYARWLGRPAPRTAKAGPAKAKAKTRAKAKARGAARTPAAVDALARRVQRAPLRVRRLVATILASCGA